MIRPGLPLVAKPFACIALAICVVSVAGFAQRGTIGLAYEITYSQQYDPSLSPDGKRLVFISAVAGREQLFIGNIDGTGAVQITRDSIDHEDPSWSPDGQRIAFSYMRDTVARIAVMNIDGTGVALLTPPTMRAIHPSWTPNG